MCRWVTEIRPKSVLDPAMGTGIFVRTLDGLLPGAQITGIELDPTAFNAARQVMGRSRHIELLCQDFLTWRPDDAFDAVVANPPYLRHHDFHYCHDIIGEIGARAGVTLSGLTNIYVLFVLEICRRLKMGGRAAIIIPAEWTNANFGAPFKRYLLRNRVLQTLVYFSHRSLQFDDALTTAAILLLERKRGTTSGDDSFRSIYVDKGARLNDVDQVIRGAMTDAPHITVRQLDSAEMLEQSKWDRILRAGISAPHEGFVPLSSVAQSKRGIATGANEFFHVSRQCAAARNIREQNLKRCVGRAADVEGVIFSPEDFTALIARERRTHLISLETEPNAQERHYIESGEKQGLASRYLLAARRPWWTMERRDPAPIWAAVFGRKLLRFIYNAAGVHNLTTFHALYPSRTDPLFVRALVAVLNSGLVQDLARGQYRVYGGGLMKFEPRDLLEIAVPDLLRAKQSVLEELSEVLGVMDDELRTAGRIGEHTDHRLNILVRAGIPVH